MTIQEKMIEYRTTHNINIEDIAKNCHVSLKLLNILESGGVTHPKLAKVIGKAYGLDDLEIEELMPINYREHGPEYNPDKYKERIDPRDMKIPPKERHP